MVSQVSDWKNKWSVIKMQASKIVIACGLTSGEHKEAQL